MSPHHSRYHLDSVSSSQHAYSLSRQYPISPNTNPTYLTSLDNINPNILDASLDLLLDKRGRDDMDVLDA